LILPPFVRTCGNRTFTKHFRGWLGAPRAREGIDSRY
jgi:hypothetical protein